MEGNRQGIRDRETDTCQRFRTVSSLQWRGIGMGIRERETDTCQRFRALSSLQWRGIGGGSETGRQTHDRDSGHLVAYSGGE